MEVSQNRLDRGFYKYQNELEEKALEVLRSGWYILGPEVEGFEKEFAKYCGTEYCVGLASGLDALWLAFRVLGIGEGDEVLVPANTYIASVMGITINGATPVFVDATEDALIDVEKLVLEGGENYTVNLRSALVEDVEVTATGLKEMTYEEVTDDDLK